MKAKTAPKWTAGVIAFVILIGVGAVVWLSVAFFVSMERGEEHQRQFSRNSARENGTLVINRPCSLSPKVS
jgi:hypothetical protein